MFAELVPASGRALGPEHPDTLMARLNLATFTGGGGCGRIPGLLTKLASSLNRVLRPEQRPDPPSGSPHRQSADTFVNRYLPHGVRHPDGEADRRPGRKGPSSGNPGQDDPDAADAQDGSGPETSISPGSSACPARGGRPCPRTPQRRPPRRGSERLPETSVFLLGVTLSDERGRGERARSRRYGRPPSRQSGPLRCTRTG